MFNIIIILAGSMALGRIWLRVTGHRLRLAEAMLGYVVWVMLAAFGFRLGTDPTIMDSLPSLGLQALILGVGCALSSGLAMSVVARHISTGDDNTLTDPGKRGEGSGSPLLNSAITLAFFAGGMVAGRLGLLPIGQESAQEWAGLLLQILIALVGLSTGSNPELTSIFRHPGASFRAALVTPIVALAATLAAGALMGLLFPTGPADSALAVSGMGYYSLSSMIISDLRAEAIGGPAAMTVAAIALMSNIVREIFSLLILPLVGSRLGLYGATAMTGVTSIDVTLPTLVSVFGAPAVAASLINGIILEVSTPFTVMALCCLSSPGKS
ncbi:MAG: lysine exporter LysO family protein [Pseudoflavonifractor sp.]|nr:lysine exporter LysO family protein [Alloprevotella sp.]MCM1117609.1 lysine exporter LysO family protein [Pseudoflavonifractor sp.]